MKYFVIEAGGVYKAEWNGSTVVPLEPGTESKPVVDGEYETGGVIRL